MSVLYTLTKKRVFFLYVVYSLIITILLLVLLYEGTLLFQKLISIYIVNVSKYL